MKEDNKMHLRNSAKEALLQVLPKYKKYFEIIDSTESDKMMKETEKGRKFVFTSEKIENSVTNYIINNAHNIYEADCGINPTLIYSLILDDMIMKKLCKLCIEGNIDLEIEIIEDNKVIAEFILRKLHVEMNAEDLIMETIENYDGTKSFRIFMSTIAKEHKNQKRLTK